MENLEEIKIEELKRIQLEILDNVANFCEKNKINYWLDCGTLLGAIRHKGYIPWDDDIDIGMLREDYERFMKLYNKENEQYKFYCIENNKKFDYPHGKVIDTNTILYELDMKHGKKIGHKNYGPIDKPKMLDEMISISEILSKNFEHVRVDLYCENDRIYFGELTFTTGSGYSGFVPNEFDYELGSKLNIDNLKMEN